MARLAPAYQPRRPTETVLYGAVRETLETFLAHARETYTGPLPRYVEREFRGYMRCGVFAHGFTRCHCEACGSDLLVAFSCKGRGLCPSCAGRRMANAGATLVDRVLPDVPVRQFVLSLPYELRLLAAFKPDVLRAAGSDEGGAIEVGCWAHARRRFFEAQLTDRERALIGLGFIKRLYEADRVASRAPPVRRTEERQRLAAPVLEAFKAWLDAESLVVLPKAPIAEALGYARNQWGALTRFLDDARLKLDNNSAERQLRRVAVGRKNWLFAGSDEGAERACILYSLIASCKLHGVNPFDYLRDVLLRVGDHPARDVLALSPKNWKKPAKDLDTPQSVASAG